jgi:uncharacterized protein
VTTTPDPRPTVVEHDGAHAIEGWRCTECSHPTLWSPPRCPVCGGHPEATTFGRGGAVWSSTVVRVAVPGRTPPYGLAYVDLDDGPRVLAHVDAGVDATERLTPGTRVRLTGATPDGDVRVVRA